MLPRSRTPYKNLASMERSGGTRGPIFMEWGAIYSITTAFCCCCLLLLFFGPPALRLRKFCSLPQVLFGEKVLCHSCSQSFWWQMFCCSWTTYLEQFTCQSARQRSQLHRIQKTTENIHVSDGLRHIVTFLIIAPYKYSYLLTYLLPMLIARWSHDAANRHTTAPTATPGLQPIARSR